MERWGKEGKGTPPWKNVATGTGRESKTSGKGKLGPGDLA